VLQLRSLAVAFTVALTLQGLPQADALSPDDVTVFTNDAYGTSRIIRQTAAPVGFVYCAFGNEAVGQTVGWTKNGRSFLVTHGSAELELAHWVHKATIAIFGYRTENYGTPIVAVQEIFAEGHADQDVVLDSRGPVAFDHGLSLDFDLKFETRGKMDVSPARFFACAILSAEGDGHKFRDARTASMLHSISYGRTR
jgi:hypothetical protein